MARSTYQHLDKISLELLKILMMASWEKPTEKNMKNINNRVTKLYIEVLKKKSKVG